MGCCWWLAPSAAGSVEALVCKAYPKRRQRAHAPVPTHAHAGECDYYKAFINSNKAVLGTEYSYGSTDKICQEAKSRKISLLLSKSGKWYDCQVWLTHSGQKHGLTLGFCA